jgi:hypothetical protein
MTNQFPTKDPQQIFGAMLAEKMLLESGRGKRKSHEIHLNAQDLTNLIQSAFESGAEVERLNQEASPSQVVPVSAAKLIASIKASALACKAGSENEAFLRIVSDCAALQTVLGVCQTPPLGWACSRGGGHHGPCAAHDVVIAALSTPAAKPTEEQGS